MESPILIMDETENEKSICFSCKYWDWSIIRATDQWFWEDICLKHKPVMVLSCEEFKDARKSKKDESS